MQAKQLSDAFRQIIASWLGTVELAEIDTRNANESDKRICHSHDFCDANQAMIDALESLGMDYDAQDDAQAKLISEAWEIAAKHGFSR